MKNVLISIKITLAFCVVLFVGYVLVLWGVAGVVAPNKGEAEVLTLNGKVVGASNVGQTFTADKYFWSRPSSVDYDGGSSGGSNKSNGNPEYLEELSARIDTFMVKHPYLSRNQVPAEMITASASGLDPHITSASALAQAERVAQSRGVSASEVTKIIEDVTETPFVGRPVVNVLKLNIALDEKYNN